MTTFEAWTGKKSNMKHLQIYGYLCVLHMFIDPKPKDELQKLDYKTSIPLGYGTKTKGYRLYDEKHGKVLYSQDVLFSGSNCGVQSIRTKGERLCKS